MQTNKCQEIEKLLINSSFESTDPETQTRILEHLKTCANCRKSELILQSIQQVMELELLSSSINPEPGLKQSLLEVMKSKKKRKKKIILSIREFLNIRIPLYQPLAAALLIIFILMFFGRNDQQSHSEEIIIAVIDTNAIQMNISYPFDLIENQHVGRNIQEDSVLSGFTHSSM